nr:MAG TPA: hypothetical protein [Caudoviricetes sp.]
MNRSRDSFINRRCCASAISVSMRIYHRAWATRRTSAEVSPDAQNPVYVHGAPVSGIFPCSWQ